MKSSDYSGIEVNQLQFFLEFRCSESEHDQLTREVTGEEIQKTLFAMPNNMSPGPDDFTNEFFKATWLITGKDFITAVQSFFIKGFLPKGLNSTILVLIVKKEEAIEMKDYRPISLCNVLYKVFRRSSELFKNHYVGNHISESVCVC